MQSNQYSVLVLGGYGNFGKRICEVLSRDTALRLVIAGRQLHKAAALCRQLGGRSSPAVLEAASLDIDATDFGHRLQDLGIDLLIHCCGPFQGQDYRVARACIAAGSHYIDLADDRRFVCDIGQLQQDAANAGVLIVSGASSVPALSSAVVDELLPEFESLERLDYAIAPGNRLERGFATIKAILSYTGHPFTTWQDGRWQQVYGWMDSVSRDFGAPIGRRHLANIDIPDLELFPSHYPSLNTVRFRAGLELAPMHHFMVLMAWCTKNGLIKSWAPFTRLSLMISNCFYYLGSDTGGMRVDLSGKGRDGLHNEISWTLIADNGVGPYIPTIPALLVARGIARGDINKIGATPCLGFFTLADFQDFAAQWGIYARSEYVHD